LYISFIIIGAMIPLFIGLGTALLILHRTGKLQLYEIKA